MGSARISVGAVWAAIESTPDQVAAVREALAVADPGAERTWRFQSGQWDGKIRLMQKGDDFFPAGLTCRVRDVLLSLGYPKPQIDWPTLGEREPLVDRCYGMDERDYQDGAVAKAIRARRICVQFPTGTGKTELGMEYVRRLGRPALWLIHRKGVRDQTEERFASAFRMSERAGSMIEVAMVQTLYSRLERLREEKYFERFEVVVLDEAHRGGADSPQAVLAECVNAHYRLGLSATLDTLTDPVARMRLEGAIGPTWVAGETVEMARAGFIAMPRIKVLRPPPESYPSYEEVREAALPGWRSNPRKLMALGGKMYNIAYENGIVRNDARNRIVTETALRHAASREKFCVLVARVPHAALLASEMKKRQPEGVVVLALDGGASDLERRAALNVFARSERGAVLVATPFFREGFNVPEVDAGMLAGAELSDTAVIQGLGRMLRRRPDKDEVLIYVMKDGGAESERPDKDWLAQHSYSQVSLFEKKGFVVEE